MGRALVLALLAGALLGVGWTAGRAQTPAADFEITIDAPIGAVTLTCHRGCEPTAEWMRKGPGLTAQVMCSGTNRCRATVNGRGLVRP